MSLDKNRFEKQLSFLVEIDKMKSVFRRTMLIDLTRRENDAEHSWHFALTALVLLEYAKDDVDITRVIKMALVHDLVEVYAGDTFAYDEAGYVDKEERELKAADKIFGMLPDDQRDELRALWDEFEDFKSKESCYANAIDRLQPFINNYKTDGYTWREGNVNKAQVYKRMDAVRLYAPELWPFLEYVIDDAIGKGYIRP
ncbi:MAG: HD domain-containing protein [Ruminococcaceae bacterium]|nr:HD domain-containing protein [Oscillospiraceae bacterium]